MAIGDKDVKILWSRAVGRCSICKKKLVVDASKASPSRATLIGQNCHIVGEKPNSPRGKSSLSRKDRNRYPNLILLCAEHHTIIDDDPAAWPIELLHQVKADHELWAENLVPDDLGGEIGKLYASLVNRVTQCLQLETWRWLTDNAIRDLLPVEFVEGVRELSVDVARTVWPGKYPVLESALRNVANRATAYLDAFLELAYQDRHDWFREDRRWKRELVRDYDKRIARANAWQRRCARLLFNLTHAINEFAGAVRSTIQPTYFLHEGKFYVLDSLGVTSEMKGCIYVPKGYDDRDRRGRPMKSQRPKSQRAGKTKRHRGKYV